MLSREQNALLQFKLESMPLKEMIADTGVKSLIGLNNVLIEAVGYFGVCEHYARQAERSSLVKTHLSRVKHSELLMKRHNEVGVEILSGSQSHLRELASQFGEGRPRDTDEKVKVAVNDVIGELKAVITEFETKPSDIKKISNAIDEVHAAFKKSGHEGIIKLLDKKFVELSKLRKSPDRGAVDNIPIWKAIAIVAAVGIWILGFIHCGWFRCSVAWGAAYAIGFNIAVLIARFC